MILVSTGTNGAAFDRLLGALGGARPGEEMIVQHGPSSVRPVGATCVAAMPFNEFRELAAQARVIVTHAGVGSTLVAMLAGHRPILVPRLARFGEAVDDHQLELAERLAALGAATLVTDVALLPAAIGEAAGASRRGAGFGSDLVQALADYVSEALDAPSPPSRPRSSGWLTKAIGATRN